MSVDLRPSILMCACCNEFLTPPIRVLLNCGHGIHVTCRGQSSCCHICNASFIGSCDDTEFERVIGMIHKLGQAILEKMPALDFRSLKRHILFEAVANGDKGVVLLLLSDGVPADIKVDDISLLSKAHEVKRDDIVEVVWKKGASRPLTNGPEQCASVNFTHLMEAEKRLHNFLRMQAVTQTWDIKCAQRLLDAGFPYDFPDHQGRTLFNLAVEAQREELSLYLKQLSLLSRAVVDGRLEDVQQLIESGVSVVREDHDGYFPLYLAAEKSDPRMLRLLLEHGAIIHLNKRHIRGLTPIEAASKVGKEENVQVLKEYLEKGCPAPPATGDCSTSSAPSTGAALQRRVPLTVVSEPEGKTGCFSCLKHCSIL